ncbi:MAG: YceI family protein [Pseudomonadota bacterium]
MPRFLLTTATAALTAFAVSGPAQADPVAYAIDASHAQALFSYTHLGMSTTFGMFSGWEGEILFDADAPEASSVTAAIPTLAMFTGWEARDNHFQSDDFLGTSEDDMVTFASTGIEVTGDTTAMITGDLTINGITQEIVLDTVMNFSGAHPAPNMGGVPSVGFTGSTTILRSDFDAGAFAPFVSDEVEVTISLEAVAAES